MMTSSFDKRVHDDGKPVFSFAAIDAATSNPDLSPAQKRLVEQSAHDANEAHARGDNLALQKAVADLRRVSDELDQKAAVRRVLHKAQNSYGIADAAADASEEVLELKDIDDLPEVVRAQVADDRTAEVFRRLYNAGIALGQSPFDALNDAWGKIVETSTRTPDGKYITGSLS